MQGPSVAALDAGPKGLTTSAGRLETARARPRAGAAVPGSPRRCGVSQPPISSRRQRSRARARACAFCHGGTRKSPERSRPDGKCGPRHTCPDVAIARLAEQLRGGLTRRSSVPLLGDVQLLCYERGTPPFRGAAGGACPLAAAKMRRWELGPSSIRLGLETLRGHAGRRCVSCRASGAT